MLEAVKSVIVFLKSKNTLRKIETFCDAENIQSQNVLIKSGFSKKQILKHWAIFPLLGEEARDCISYVLEIN